ncbi:MAG: DUF1501 domain-containing protein [Pirellulaceae bacterium]|nr:DUF1501 domain-containing protein [Pirellulaceae bacterium]
MLTILGQPQTSSNGISRRRLIQAAGGGLLGLSLPQVLAAESLPRSRPVRARSVIFVFLFGGPSQFETFDMKPDAPEKIRGPFKPTPARTSGLLISEHLARLASISDKYCVVRTMTHPYNDHSGAGHYLQTGRQWQIPIGGGFSATPKDWPSMGSVVEYLAQHEPGGLARDLPSYAALPNWLGRLQDRGQYRRPGQYGGWLGRGYDPLTTRVDKRELNDNPYWRDCSDEELTFQIEGLMAADDLPPIRLRQRQTLLEQFDASRRTLDGRPVREYDQFRQRAVALATSETTRRALDIRQEPDSLRDRYGRHLFGQSALMARRLVEAGTRFVTVHYDCVDGYSWDSHLNSQSLQKHLLPTLDQGLSALLEDLDQRGLLAETLVVAMGEMGRTPQANASWGRGHWSTLFPALLAGAGIAGGTLYGSSDKDAAYPVDHPVRPEDLAATIYDALGIDPDLRLPDAQGRPVHICEGQPVRGLWT